MTKSKWAQTHRYYTKHHISLKEIRCYWVPLKGETMMHVLHAQLLCSVVKLFNWLLVVCSVELYYIRQIRSQWKKRKNLNICLYSIDCFLIRAKFTTFDIFGIQLNFPSRRWNILQSRFAKCEIRRPESHISLSCLPYIRQFSIQTGWVHSQGT